MKAYAFTISTDVCFNLINTAKGEELVNICKGEKLIGVYQDPDGIYQAFLFRTPRQRNKAYDKVIKAGIESAVIIGVTAEIDDIWGETNGKGC